MRITALIENTRPDDRAELTAEFGLSLFVERDGQRILFDTGASGAFSENAEKLGIDLQGVDAVVISHHHFDHGGGLARFLEANRRAKVYLRKSAEESFYFKAPLLGERYVGLDRELLQEQAGRLEFIEGFTEVLPGTYILTAIDTQYAQPKGNRRLFVKKGDACEPDNFGHELMMVTREEDGLVVFSGCSHHGIQNMLSTATRQFPNQPIKAVIGGFHLIGLPVFNTMAGSKKDIRQLGGELLKYPVEQYYTGHCTGQKAYRVLKGVMADRLQRFQTGSELVI
jgi:7,8-dihydropterin-6-yl-methyl-4-(beta-D-ribofuranosyl)aminobenzene 5'-phosphate synthase